MKNITDHSKLILFLILSLLLTTNSFALTKQQKETIKLCYDESKFFGLEEIIPIMCLNESSAGVHKVGDDNTSFGILQIKLSTARWHLEKNGIKLSDESLKYLLINDNKYSIMLACSYFNYLLKQNGGDYSKAVLSYNVGLSKVRKYGLLFDPNNYLVKFNKNYKLIKREMNIYGK